MMDQIFDREYRSERGDLNAGHAGGFARLARAIGNSFEVLNRIEYQAPWTARRRKLASH